MKILQKVLDFYLLITTINMKYFFFFIICFTSCDIYDGKLILYNNSNETIYYVVNEFDVGFDSFEYYPLVYKNGKLDTLYSNIILPAEKQHHVSVGYETWEELMRTQTIDTSINIFFFSEKLIKSVSSDSLLRYQLYTKKMKLKLSDLQKLKWEVKYQ